MSRRQALAGAVGAVLTGWGDVLILGRAVSGSDFDEAVGVLPEHVVPDRRWRSLWNGAVLPPGRIWAGTLCGVVGIPLLAATGLRSSVRGMPSGAPHAVAAASVAAFALTGVLTHVSCAAVIVAYRNELSRAVDAPVSDRVPAQTATRLFGAGAVGSLASLAVLSGCAAVARRSWRSGAPRMSSAVTAFPCVVSTLLTFGRLPSPIGGSFASISTIALSTPIAASAASTCSTVCTRIEPSPIVVARSTVFRFSILASIVGSSCRSLRLNLMP